MGLIFSSSDPPMLDDETKDSIRGLAICKLIINHQKEFDKIYTEECDSRLKRELEGLTPVGLRGLVLKTSSR